MKDVGFEKYAPKKHYLEQGYKESKIGIYIERAQSISHRIKGRRKKYGFKHHISGTIYDVIGDTLYSMATEISKTLKTLKFGTKVSHFFYKSIKNRK